MRSAASLMGAGAATVVPRLLGAFWRPLRAWRAHEISARGRCNAPPLIRKLAGRGSEAVRARRAARAERGGTARARAHGSRRMWRSLRPGRAQVVVVPRICQGQPKDRATIAPSEAYDSRGVSRPMRTDGRAWHRGCNLHSSRPNTGAAGNAADSSTRSLHYAYSGRAAFFLGRSFSRAGSWDTR